MTAPIHVALRHRLTAGFCLAVVFIVAVRVARSFGVTAGGLMDVLPNLGFAVALTLLLARWTSPVVAALVALTAGAFNELAQLQVNPFFVFAGRTFDPWDLVASGAGATLGYGLVQWLCRASRLRP